MLTPLFRPTARLKPDVQRFDWPALKRFQELGLGDLKKMQLFLGGRSVTACHYDARPKLFSWRRETPTPLISPYLIRFHCMSLRISSFSSSLPIHLGLARNAI